VAVPSMPGIPGVPGVPGISTLPPAPVAPTLPTARSLPAGAGMPVPPGNIMRAADGGPADAEPGAPIAMSETADVSPLQQQVAAQQHAEDLQRQHAQRPADPMPHGQPL